jgi:putative phage-type endonuclease
MPPLPWDSILTSPSWSWLEKTGRDGDLPKTDPNDETSPMYWGTLLEPIVASHYTRRRATGCGASMQCCSTRLTPGCWPTSTGRSGAPDVQILECKTAGINGSMLWREGVPEYVQLQVMHQLAVTGKQAADVAVLLGARNCRSTGSSGTTT